jgi:hypothetical protein
MRRFTLEESTELGVWTEHWISPIIPEENDGSGFSAGGVGSRSAYFIRLLPIPWVFEPVMTSGDWLGDFQVAFDPQGALVLLFQNRTTNALHVMEQEQPGIWSEPELVATTGVPDAPGGLDNNGYSGVEFLILADGTRLITCLDQYNGEVICLEASPGGTGWTRHWIAGDFQVPAWVKATSAVSGDDQLAIAYGDPDGCFLYLAPVEEIGSGKTLFLSSESPVNRPAIVFTGSNELLAYIRSGVRIDLETEDRTGINITGNLLPFSVTNGRLVSMQVGETSVVLFRSTDRGATWNPEYTVLGDLDEALVRFDGDGRARFLTSWYGRLTAHNRGEAGAVQSVRIANGSDSIGSVFVYPNGQLGAVLLSKRGTAAVTLARQE